MRNNLLLIKNNFISLASKMFHSIPEPREIKLYIKNYWLSLKEEVKSSINKSKNLLNTNIDLGLYHFYRGNISDARFRFWLINIFKPYLPQVHYNIGRCYFVLKEMDKALKHFTKAIEIYNNYEDAIYYFNKIKNPHKITHVPENVIRQYFDYTGEHFVEYWIIAKQYRGYEYVGSLAENFFKDRGSTINILDIGCGTGVCGQFLKMNKIGQHITGVDISSCMLNIARGCFVEGKQVYDELINTNIFDFLNTNKNKTYDLIIMAEILHYFGGDLELIFQLTSQVLNKNGIIIALVRRKDGEDFAFVREGDFFCYSDKYINHKVEQAKMHITYASYCKIYGNQVDGLLFTAQH